jgi:hypothetical protein
MDNYLALDITFNISNVRTTWVVIYGTNKDNLSFYENISDTIINFENDDIILISNFNLVLDFDKYCYNYPHVNNPKAREKVLEFISSHNLADILESFILKKRYTWRKPHPLNKHDLIHMVVVKVNAIYCIHAYIWVLCLCKCNINSEVMFYMVTDSYVQIAL